MAKPVILAVNDDSWALRKVERNPRRRYAREHRFLPTESAATMLDILEVVRTKPLSKPARYARSPEWSPVCI